MNLSRPPSLAARLLLLWSALAILVALGFPIPSPAGDLRAYFDRKSVYEGDKVTLVIESTSGSLGQPDLSGLGADFDLLGTSQSTNISIVNGQRTDTVRLLVSLAPKRTGTIQVPPIPVGADRTEPLSLQVNEVPEGVSGSGGDDIFVELEVDANDDGLMVQQQVPLTVRLFTTLPLLKGNLEDPRAEGALVIKLGEDRQYSTRRDGREYQVVERRYTLSPERSGELRIPPVAFEGSMRGRGGRRGRLGGSLLDDPFFDRFFQGSPLSGDPFGMFDRGEPVSARSRGITLDVKARPGGYAGDHWLPAEALEIVDSWAESPPELRVGEPVTRTLTLQAKGLSGLQIPEIEIPSAQGLRAYPEKTESETRSDGETLYGISRQGVTLIPSQAGELAIPEIGVTWWDTVARQERVATVPGWKLSVEGGSNASSVPAPATSAAPNPEPAPEPAANEEPPPLERGLASDLPDIDRRTLTGGAGLVALLLASAWGVRRYRRRGSETGIDDGAAASDPAGSPVKAANNRKAFRSACEANDPKGAAQALLHWAQASWAADPPRNLGTLAARLAIGADEVRELERYLYAPQTASWEGADLWQALGGELVEARAAKQAQNGALEPLYPPRT